MQETAILVGLLWLIGVCLGIWLLLSPMFIYAELRRANYLSGKVLEQLESLNSRIQ